MREVVRSVVRVAFIPVALLDVALWVSFFVSPWLIPLVIPPAALAAGLIFQRSYARIIGFVAFALYALMWGGASLSYALIVAGMNVLGFVVFLVVDPVPSREDPEALTEQAATSIGLPGR